MQNGILLVLVLLMGSISIIPLSVNGQMSSMGGKNMQPNQSMMMQANQSMPNMNMSQMVYTVQAGGQSFQVTMITNGIMQQDLSFNPDQKSISFSMRGFTTRDLTHCEITVPYKLLNGNFTVMVGGKQVNFVAEPNDTNQVTTLHVNIPKSFIQQNGIGDSSTVMITATQAIPEFGSMVGVVIVVSIIGVLALSSRKFMPTF